MRLPEHARRALHVDEAERVGEVEVVARLEVELRLVTPIAHERILRLVEARRHVGVEEVRNLQVQRTQLGLEGGELLAHRLDALSELLAARDRLHFLVALQLRDALRDALLLRPRLVTRVAQRQHLGIDLQEAVEVDLDAPVDERTAAHFLGVLANKAQFEHGGRSYTSSRRSRASARNRASPSSSRTPMR